MAAGSVTERAAAVQAAMRTYLQITWNDEATNARILALTEDGIAYIDRLTGAPEDYESPGQPRTLLKEYVRYARDEALDVFEANYIGLINELQNDKRVTSYVESTGTAGS